MPGEWSSVMQKGLCPLLVKISWKMRRAENEPVIIRQFFLSSMVQFRHEDDSAAVVPSFRVSLTAVNILSLSMGFVRVRFAPSFLAPSR